MSYLNTNNKWSPANNLLKSKEINPGVYNNPQFIYDTLPDYKKINVEAAITKAEKRTCSHFGCGRGLSITEQLYSDHCIYHRKELKQFANGKL